MVNLKISLFLNLKQRKLVIEFFAIFFLLIIVPVTISSYIIYRSSNNVIENEVKNSNINTISSMINYIDENFMKIKEKVMLFSLNSNLKYLLSYENYGSSYPSTYTRIMDELVKFEASDKLFDEVAIYFNSPETLISRDGLYDPQYYFDKVIGMEDTDYDIWKSMLETGKFNFDIMSTKNFYGSMWNSKSSKKNVVIKTSLPYDSTPRAMLMIFLNEKYIMDSILRYGGLGRAAYTVIDKNGGIIAMSGSDNMLTEKVVEDNIARINEHKNGNFRTDLSTQILSVTCSESSLTGWIYMTAVPLSEISQQSQYVKTISFYIVVIFIIIGLILSILLTIREYRPVENLIGYLDNLKEGEGERTGNSRYAEYTLIKNQLRTIYSSNERLQNSLNASLPFLQENFFYRLLKGNFLSKEELMAESLKYGIAFPHEYFSVISVKIDIPGCNKEGATIPADVVDIRNRIKSIVGAILNRDLISYSVEMDIFNIAYIINFKSELKDTIEVTCKLIADFFNTDKYHTRLTMGIDNKCGNLLTVQNLYANAVKALSLRTISNRSETVIYSDSPSNINSKSFDASFELKTITNCFLSGEFDKGLAIAEQVLNKCISHNISYADMNNISKRLLNSALSALEIKGYNPEQLGFSEENTYKEIDTFINQEEYSKHFIKIFNNVKVILSNRKGKKKEEIIEYIVKYVSENYMRDIYLELVAYELGISANYLSHFFKECMGIGFSEYLGRARVGKSKELLQTTAKCINDISGEVGYVNVSSFIRAFKKIEGITPGRYREIKSLQ